LILGVLRRVWARLWPHRKPLINNLSARNNSRAGSQDVCGLSATVPGFFRRHEIRSVRVALIASADITARNACSTQGVRDHTVAQVGQCAERSYTLMQLYPIAVMS
jgi:hypothetical protein